MASKTGEVMARSTLCPTYFLDAEGGPTMNVTSLRAVFWRRDDVLCRTFSLSMTIGHLLVPKWPLPANGKCQQKKKSRNHSEIRENMGLLIPRITMSTRFCFHFGTPVIRGLQIFRAKSNFDMDGGFRFAYHLQGDVHQSWC
ncbi:hypothetical protein CDAR_71811 [Caerostris darwini]|uniref:Uncharacterized protein n=1 Tax=Caerostris darwini TaxID=1538125 RepID=A0AAV4TJ24_9ARAC|nr:hypothetical protein CDAR_71811 [Caerostris darwini]